MPGAGSPASACGHPPSTLATAGHVILQHDFIRDEINKMGVVPYFEWATRRKLAERVVGARFLYYQLEPEYARRWNVPDIPSLLPVLEGRKALRIIHLKRRNLLATLVSWKLARKTHRWRQPGSGQVSHGNSADDDITINLRYEECRDEFAQTEQWERYYDAAFSEHPFVELYYEDLVSNRRGKIARVLGFPGLENRELRSPLRKQNPRGLEDVVENFAEPRQRFADTPYADFFTTTVP